MPPKGPLTAIAQHRWRSYLHPEAIVVDATVGNGQDTLFLARIIRPNGRVYSIDLQESAIDSTSHHLHYEGLLDVVTLIKADHARLTKLLPSGITGKVDLVCFNLGYLPGGDHEVITCPETTLPALSQAIELLKPGGAISIIAYRGHPGGKEEAEAVDQFLNSLLEENWRLVECQRTGNEASPGPVWWLLERQKTA